MKVTVIGGGVMGSNHARILHSMGKLHKIVEPNETNASRLKNLYGSDVVVDKIDYSSDCYVIATPTSTHYDLAKQIISLNIPVLIEKPLCQNMKQARELKKLITDKSIVGVGHVEHFNPIVKHTKEWLNNKKINLINTYRLGHCDRINDVGVVLDLAIHDIEVMSYLLDDKAYAVTATGIYNGKEHEQYCKVFVEFTKGTLGCLEVSWIHPSKIRKIEIVGDIYFATADYLQQTFTEDYEYFVESLGNGFTQKRVKESMSTSLAKQEPLRLELEDFLFAVENKTKPSVSFEDGMQALETIEAILYSITSKERVLV